MYDDTMLVDKDFYNKLKEHYNHFQWISVKDRLPANDGLYIVCRTIYPYQIVFEAKWEDGKWVSVVEPKQLGYITHWMPLPEPPSQKEKPE